MNDGLQTGLWLAVIVSGLYHGLSPGMGWPLTVAAGLSEKRGGAVFAALVPLAFGHFAAMAVVLLPFALLAVVSDHSSGIRIGAGVLVVGFGLYRLFDHRHPRLLARIKPTQLALWSFLVAIALADLRVRQWQVCYWPQSGPHSITPSYTIPVYQDYSLLKVCSGFFRSLD